MGSRGGRPPDTTCPNIGRRDALPGMNRLWPRFPSCASTQDAPRTFRTNAPILTFRRGLRPRFYGGMRTYADFEDTDLPPMRASSGSCHSRTRIRCHDRIPGCSSKTKTADRGYLPTVKCEIRCSKATSTNAQFPTELPTEVDRLRRGKSVVLKIGIVRSRGREPFYVRSLSSVPGTNSLEASRRPRGDTRPARCS